MKLYFLYITQVLSVNAYFDSEGINYVYGRQTDLILIANQTGPTE